MKTPKLISRNRILRFSLITWYDREGIPLAVGRITRRFRMGAETVF